MEIIDSSSVGRSAWTFDPLDRCVHSRLLHVSPLLHSYQYFIRRLAARVFSRNRSLSPTAMGGRRQGYNDYNDGYGGYGASRYDADNMRNKQQLRAGNGRQSPYALVPPAPVPTMGITINQNTGPTIAQHSPSPYSSGSHGGLLPSAPPPSYHDGNILWLDRFPRRENRGMFRLCLVEFMLAIVILGGGIWCYIDTADYCPYYSAIWTSVIFLLNAIVGSAAAKVGTINLYMGHLVLSLVAISVCAVSAGLSVRFSFVF
jgi:hypothetical protein